MSVLTYAQAAPNSAMKLAAEGLDDWWGRGCRPQGGRLYCGRRSGFASGSIVVPSPPQLIAATLGRSLNTSSNDRRRATLLGRGPGAKPGLDRTPNRGTLPE
jgi:hypothetical protein